MKYMLVLAASVCAFAQIERPSLGLMLDQNNDVRPLFGTLASATPGDAILRGVVSMECSARGCLAKAAAQIMTSDGQTSDAPSGPAIFGGTYAYFPDTQQMAQWQGGSLIPIPFAADGEVLALRPKGDGFDYAVVRDGATWIEHLSFRDNSLRVVNTLPAAIAALFINETTLLAFDDAVHLLQPDGTDTLLGIPGVKSLFKMSDHTVEFVTAQGMWGFDIATHQLRLLPGVAP